MAEESVWVPVVESNSSRYPQCYHREDRRKAWRGVTYRLAFEDIYPEPRWVLCLASGDVLRQAPGRHHNSKLTVDDAEKAKAWADGIIGDDGLRRVHASRLF